MQWIHLKLRINKAEVTESITAYLVDGRSVRVPLARSWRLSEAAAEQRTNYEIIEDGQGIHWPNVDEDINAEGMLYGMPAPRQCKSQTTS